MQEEKKATAPKKKGAAKRRKRSARTTATAAKQSAATAAKAETAENPAPAGHEAPRAEPAPAPEPAERPAAETPEAPQTAEPAEKAAEPHLAETPETTPAQGEETPAEAAENAPAETAAAPAEETSEPEPAQTPAEEPEPAEPQPEELAAAASAEEPTEPEPAQAPAEEPAEPAQEEPKGEAPELPQEEPAAEATPEPAETAETEPESAETQPEEPAAAASAEEPAEPAQGEPKGEAPEPPQEEPAAEATPEPAENAETEPEAEKPAADAPAEEPDLAKTEEPDEEPQPEPDEQRISDLTRTVQLSIEQITAHLDDVAAEGAEPAPAAETPPEEPAPTLTDHLRGGVERVVRWLLSVLIFVLVIAVSGVVWLYRSATPDLLPQIRVTFAGQEIASSSYRWKVPVVGKAIKRTYAETRSTTPTTLEQPVEQASPDFTVSGNYRSELTVTDAEDAVLYEGDVETFANFQFPENGDYAAELTVYSDESPVAGDATVTGQETWQIAFTVNVRPAVHLFATSVQQGGVAAVTVGDTVDGKPPQISTTLKNAGFGKASTGWVCYLPIPWNQAPGKQSLTVTVGDSSETLEFEVGAAKWDYKDYSSNYNLVSPYIGETEIPAELSAVLNKSETQVAWVNSSFVQPLLNTLDVELYYGTTEYVGRSRSQRDTNPGIGGRTATNMVLSTTWGELLIAPANGTVVLAKDLGDGFGNTLVIDHGAGVKSIFYHLQQLNVKTGDRLKQGQSIATCGSALVAEMRIGTVPIDPRPVWRAQCDALKHY